MNDDYKTILAEFILAKIDQGQPLTQSVGDTILYPTGFASGDLHPDHPNHLDNQSDLEELTQG